MLGLGDSLTVEIVFNTALGVLAAITLPVIRSVTQRAIVVKSGNMSLGVNLLAALVKRAAQSLDESFDIEILEHHHKAKVDAPSGTALDGMVRTWTLLASSLSPNFRAALATTFCQ